MLYLRSSGGDRISCRRSVLPPPHLPVAGSVTRPRRPAASAAAPSRLISPGMAARAYVGCYDDLDRIARRVRAMAFFHPGSFGSARSATKAVTGIRLPLVPRMSATSSLSLRSRTTEATRASAAMGGEGRRATRARPSERGGCGPHRGTFRRSRSGRGLPCAASRRKPTWAKPGDRWDGRSWEAPINRSSARHGRGSARHGSERCQSVERSP